jgi:hypothetical protein
MKSHLLSIARNLTSGTHEELGTDFNHCAKDFVEKHQGAILMIVRKNQEVLYIFLLNNSLLQIYF